MDLLIQYTLVFTSVLTLVALGGCFSEHSGVINIGLEGIMVIGALGGSLVLKYMSVTTPAIWVVLATVGVAIAAGVIYSLLLGVASITFKADQTRVAAATVVVKSVNIAETMGSNNSPKVIYSAVKDKLLIVQGTEYSWFLIFALVLLIASYIVLYKTKFGLRLQACGEHPQAAASVGINVLKMRYAGVMISGALGGLGGIVYITAGVSQWSFDVGVAGFGFLSLAVMIFGQWKPVRIVLAALLFGLFRALGSVYTGFDFLNNLNIPKSVYNMLPYIVSLIVLALTSKRSRAPKAEGIPYDKGMR